MKNQNHIRTNSKRLIPKLIFLCFFLGLSSFALAQQVTVSFQPKNSTEKIDSVHVTNLTKDQTVKLDAGETVVFTPATYVNHFALEEADNGYLYPNPFNDYTTLAFNTTKSRKVFIAIYTMSGQKIFSHTQNLSPGSHMFQLQFPASGLYNVIVLGDKKPLSYKAVYLGKNQQKVDIQYLGSEELPDNEHPLSQLKSVRNEKSLDYSNGDVVHYLVYSGDNTTVIADAPTTSTTIEVEFYECKDADDKNYKIVQIGEQWWMAENYAYLHDSILNNGAWVYNYSGDDVNIAKKHANYKEYGVLYDWETANKICPEGWHLPAKEEWQQLFDFINSKEYSHLITWDLSCYSNWPISSLPENINLLGFSGKFGGLYAEDSFEDIGHDGYFWSATEFEDNTAASYNYWIGKGIGDLRLSAWLKIAGLSIRL